jgi:hypothetical protein
VLTDTYIRQPTEPRDEPAVNLQISLRTEPPTARASAPSAIRVAKTARVAGAISHFAPARLGKRPLSPAHSITLPRVYSMRPGSMRPSLKTGGT